MRSRPSFVCLALGLLLSGSAFGQYRTPGTGEVYTLEQLAALAGDVLEQTETGMVLHDQLIISPSDELAISGGELLVATREMRPRSDPYGTPIELPITPVIFIEGTLHASDWTLKSIPDASRYALLGHGITVSGLGHEGAADATIVNCTFERLGVALSARGGGSAVVEASRFLNCNVSGAVAYMNGDLTVGECYFQSCGVDVLGSAKIQLENSRVEGAGVSIMKSLAGSTITGCRIVGQKGIGLNVMSEENALITANQVGGFEYGVSFSHGASARFEGNAVWGNQQAGIVFWSSSTPVVRGNRIVYNAVGTASPQGQHPRGALLVMEDAQPDLGRDDDPGLNYIRFNGGLSLYHVGSETISAQGNDWGETSAAAVEDLIYHQPDDGDDSDGSGFVSGMVVFEPVRNLDQGPPTPDLDLSGLVDTKDLLLFQQEWHRATQ